MLRKKKSKKTQTSLLDGMGYGVRTITLITKMLTPLDRAQRYVAATPPSISGQGGHSQTFGLATALAHGFNLSESEVYALLQVYNLSCSPPWSEKEIKHKIRQAYSTTHDKPRGWLLGDGVELEPRKFSKTQSVTQSGKFKVNLGSASAVPMSEQFTTRELLLNCFKHDEVICVTNEAGSDEDGRFFPASKGTFQTVQWWLDRYFGETPADKELFHAKPQGAWIRINPIKPDDYSGRDDSVAIFRFVLVEFDTRPKEEQYAIFKQSCIRLPV